MMSNLADEITIPPRTKRGRHDESENEDRLSDLPDCVLLHILSFLCAKHAVRTCILATRWKHLWKLPDLLKVKLPSLCNLKSLKVKLKPLSFRVSQMFRAAKLQNKSGKEAAKVRKALKAGFEPSETILDGMLGFLLQNSPEAKVDIIDYCRSSRKPIQNDTLPNEDTVEKSQPNTHSPPLDNGP